MAVILMSARPLGEPAPEWSREVVPTGDPEGERMIIAHWLSLEDADRSTDGAASSGEATIFANPELLRDADA